jgi:hypothetical protein
VIGFLVLCTFIYIMHRPFPARCSASTLQSSTCLPGYDCTVLLGSEHTSTCWNKWIWPTRNSEVLFEEISKIYLFMHVSKRTVRTFNLISKKVEVAMFKYKSFLYFLKYIGK